MSDLKVKKGDNLSAEMWNSVVDRLPGSESGFGVGGSGFSRVECVALNDSGSDREIGELLVVDSYSGPSGAVYDIESGPLLTCNNPTWHTDISRVVVLSEPIADGDYGRVVLSGFCIIRLSAGAATDNFLMIDPANVNQMKGTTSGIARLIGFQDIGGDKYALANFRDESNVWHYELTQASQAPSDTTAKLVDLAGTEYAASINLSDPKSYMDDQSSGDTGTCILSGDKFYALQANCG